MSAAKTHALPDAHDRHLAATLFDRNLVVTAGAGTGKTALLIERVLNLIGSGRERIGTLAAITFTEKAAAELRQRFATGLDALQRLAAADADPDGADSGGEAGRSYRWLRGEAAVTAGEIRLRARNALIDLDSASISTIHSFCGEMLRRFPDEAGVDPSFTPDEGQAFKLIFDEEWERFLTDETGSRPPRPDLWRRVLNIPGAIADIRSLGMEMAGLGITADPGGGHPGRSRMMDAAASHLRKRLFALLAATSDMNPNLRTYIAGAAQLLADFVDGGAEAMAATSSPLSLDAFLVKGVPTTGKGMTGMGPEEVLATVREALPLIRHLARIDEERIAAVVEAAGPLAARARGKLLAAGYISFDMLLQIARDLLAGSPRIRSALGSRFGTILVDEFQDTDPLQYEILFHLSEDGQGGIRPGSLFIVGDPKQSIYRFRGADMEAYRRAVNRLLACEGVALSLRASFRSPEEIVAPVNHLFGKLMAPATGEELAWEVAYEPISSARGAAGAAGSGAEIWTVDGEGNAEAGRQREASAIAAWIAANRGGVEATGSPLRLKDVGILLRALTNAGIYAQALRRAGIPYVVEGGRGFYERPEVADLIAFLRAALNPRDGPAVLAVMRSPVGGVDDVELARFADAGGRLDDPVLPKSGTDAFPGVARTFDLLAGFRATMPARGVEAIVADALHRTNLLLVHASAWEGPQRVANLAKIAARAGEVARRGLSLEETIEFIEREYREEVSHGDAPLADETVDAVRILSVHKAKGLEYPVVVIPDLGRRELPGTGRGAGASLVRSADGAFLAVRLSGGQTNTAMAWKSLADGWHGRAEEKRVFYVAATRAERRLILVNSVTGREAAPWRNALAALGYDASEGAPPEGPMAGGLVTHRVPPEDGAPAEAAPIPLDPRWAAAAAAFDAAARGIAAGVHRPTRSPSGAGDLRVAGGPDEEGPPEPITAPPAGDGDVARLAGTAVHAALEAWEFSDRGRLLSRGEQEAARAAAAEGRGGDQVLIESVRRESVEILEAFLASPLPASLASRMESTPGLIREAPFMCETGDADGEGAATWLGAVDLIYRDPDGTWVVADYKTGRVKGDPAEEAARHAPQLAVYASALRRALGEGRVRAEVIFVRAGIAVPLELSAG